MFPKVVQYTVGMAVLYILRRVVNHYRLQSYLQKHPYAQKRQRAHQQQYPYRVILVAGWNVVWKVLLLLYGVLVDGLLLTYGLQLVGFVWNRAKSGMDYLFVKVDEDDDGASLAVVINGQTNDAAASLSALNHAGTTKQISSSTVRRRTPLPPSALKKKPSFQTLARSNGPTSRPTMESPMPQQPHSEGVSLSSNTTTTTATQQHQPTNSRRRRSVGFSELPNGSVKTTQHIFNPSDAVDGTTLAQQQPNKENNYRTFHRSRSLTPGTRSHSPGHREMASNSFVPIQNILKKRQRDSQATSNHNKRIQLLPASRKPRPGSLSQQNHNNKRQRQQELLDALGKQQEPPPKKKAGPSPFKQLQRQFHLPKTPLETTAASSNTTPSPSLLVANNAVHTPQAAATTGTSQQPFKFGGGQGTTTADATDSAPPQGATQEPKPFVFGSQKSTDKAGGDKPSIVFGANAGGAATTAAATTNNGMVFGAANNAAPTSNATTATSNPNAATKPSTGVSFGGASSNAPNSFASASTATTSNVTGFGATTSNAPPNNAAASATSFASTETTNNAFTSKPPAASTTQAATPVFGTNATTAGASTTQTPVFGANTAGATNNNDPNAASTKQPFLFGKPQSAQAAPATMFGASSNSTTNPPAPVQFGAATPAAPVQFGAATPAASSSFSMGSASKSNHRRGQRSRSRR